MAVVTSVMVRVRNADSEQPAGAGVNVGGEASAVAARTAAILSSKKRCRSRGARRLPLIAVQGRDPSAHQLTATDHEARTVLIKCLLSCSKMPAFIVCDMWHPICLQMQNMIVKEPRNVLLLQYLSMSFHILYDSVIKGLRR